MSSELATLPFLAPSTMDQALAFANQMSQARLLPAHLQKSPADCLRVVLQAARWQMDPFAVADKTSIIQNKLMYEGQLVSAVVNARGNLSKRLSYAYDGEGDNRVLTVSGTVKGETEPRTIDLPFSLAKRINKNGQMQTNPDQQAAYIGARIWARRHMPELMLGVYTPDEIDEEGAEPTNVTPEEVKPERPTPPKREAKGAAKVRETVRAEIVVPAETPASVTVAEPTPPPAPAETVATPAPEPAPEPAPDKPKDRAFLNRDERVEVVAKVKDATGFFANIDGVMTPSAQVNLAGGYFGTAFHIGGGILVSPAEKDVEGKEIKPAVLACKDPWKPGTEVRVKLVGKHSAAANKVRAVVEAVEAVPVEF